MRGRLCATSEFRERKLSARDLCVCVCVGLNRIAQVRTGDRARCNNIVLRGTGFLGGVVWVCDVCLFIK